jgi:hypothetical protein
VRWELDVNPRWQRDPAFYVEQTIGALQEAVVPPPPFGDARSREIVARAENIPSILEQAKLNLEPIAPFARLTIEMLPDIDARLARVQRGVTPLLASDDQRRRFQTAIAAASKALIDYREWLKKNLASMPQDFALGDKAYGFFLQQVALLPYTPDQLLAMARQDFERVLAMESYEHQRDLHAPELKMAATADQESVRMAHDDASIRSYLTEHQILTVPANLPHWTVRLASANWTISRAPRARMTTECAGSRRRPRIWRTSGKPTRWIRALRACTKACRATSFNCRYRAVIPIRSAASITIRASMKASASMPKR